MKKKRGKEKFCPKCGAKLKSDDDYCVKCGYSFAQRKKKSGTIPILITIIIFIILWIIIRLITKKPIFPDFSILKNIFKIGQ